MLGMGLLGTFHTIIGLIALITGLYASFTQKRISLASGSGKLYVLATVVTCLTAFGIFEHGGFGKPHVLAILTLIALAVAIVAETRSPQTRTTASVSTVAYSLTILFHLIPGVTETSTRLPQGAPLLPNADAPQLQVAYGILFVLFLLGAFLQVKWSRNQT